MKYVNAQQPQTHFFLRCSFFILGCSGASVPAFSGRVLAFHGFEGYRELGLDSGEGPVTTSKEGGRRAKLPSPRQGGSDREITMLGIHVL